MAYVVIHAPNGKRTRFALQRPATIGRAADCEIWVDDSRLSRKHCKIEPRGIERWAVADLGSTNGTYVDRKKLIMHHVLGDEQTIYVGDTRLVFYEGAFIAKRPCDPLERLMFASNMERERIAENKTVFGMRFPPAKPIPVANDELIKPKKRESSEIPLAFRRPRPRPIVYDDQGSSIG